MTEHLARKIRMYSDYIKKKDYISFLYHFDCFEMRDLFKMWKDMKVSIPLTGKGPSDANTVVVMFRKILADSHVDESDEIRISRYGIVWRDRMSGSSIQVAYSLSGKNAWVVKLHSYEEEDIEESGVGFNNLMDYLIGDFISIFMDMESKDYYL